MPIRNHKLNLQAGQQVSWVAGGKVSRLDGVAGQVVTGTLVDGIVDSDGCVSVKKSYKSLSPIGSVGVDQIL
jgi:hypothetical protein